MASLRKLNRRLHVWHRYARRTYWNPRITRPAWMGPNTAMSAAHIRAWNARELERERRFWAEAPEVWLGGPEGERALIADVLGEEPDDDACLGSCCRPDDLADEDDAYDDEGYPWPPGVIVETGLAERGPL